MRDEDTNPPSIFLQIILINHLAMARGVLLIVLALCATTAVTASDDRLPLTPEAISEGEFFPGLWALQTFYNVFYMTSASCSAPSSPHPYRFDPCPPQPSRASPRSSPM